MGLFSIFSKSTTDPATSQAAAPQTTVVNKSDFVDDTDPNATALSYTQYQTGFPIDAIYEYIGKDYEVDGYNDALCNQEPVYKDQRKEIIRNGLKHLFEQVLLRYKHDLREINVKVQLAEQQGLTNTQNALQARKETINEHMAVINDMEKSLDNNEERMLGMIHSYERGFLRGLAAKSQNFLGDGK